MTSLNGAAQRTRQLTESHIPWALKPLRQNSDLRLYDRFLIEAQPDAGGKDFLHSLNPDNLKVVTTYAEPSLVGAEPDQKFQFESCGYFVADRLDHAAGAKSVFNRLTGLSDSWTANTK
jgi:glutaminyl-tRNA synthetase